MTSEQKIAENAEALLGTLNRLRREGKTIVFTNGCFDILHAGHVRLLKFARSLGDVLVIGVNDDPSITRLKGSGRPILPLDQRVRVLSGFASVDYVVAFQEDTPAALIEKVRPDVLVKGGEYRPEEVVGRDQVESWGGRVILAPMVSDLSTQGIIKRILSRFSPDKKVPGTESNTR